MATTSPPWGCRGYCSKYGYRTGAPFDVAFDPATGAFSYPAVPDGDGQRTVVLTAMDHAYNAGAAVVHFTFDTTAPALAAALAHDTAPGGGTNADGITSDPTISGAATDAGRVVSLRAGFDATPQGSYVEVLDARSVDGRFTLDAARLGRVLGVPLTDGAMTLHLVAEDEAGNTSRTDVTFTLDRSAPSLSASGPTGPVNQSPALAGSARDATSGLFEVIAATGTRHQQVTVASDGSFSLAPDLSGDPPAEKTHGTTFTAIDLAGNVAATGPISYLVDQTAPTIRTDSPDPGLTTSDDITIVGHVADNLSGVSSLMAAVDAGPPSPVPFDPTTGQFSFTTTLPTDGTADGPHTVHFAAADHAGNPASLGFPFTLSTAQAPCVFDDLTGWTTAEDGGTQAGRGSVAVAGDRVVLREGDSFNVTLSRTFTVPAGATSLSFEYADLAFDTTATGLIRAASKASLVDATGRSLVHTIGVGRDAFFNVTDGLTPALGSEARLGGQTVTRDLSGIVASTSATLVFRLANNDGDTETSVAITCVMLPPGGPPSAAISAATGSTLATPAPVVAGLSPAGWGDGWPSTAPSGVAPAGARSGVPLQVSTASEPTIYDPGVAPTAGSSQLTFGDHLLDNQPRGSVPGAGSTGEISNDGDALYGRRTWINDGNGRADLADGVADRGAPGFAMMVWDMGRPFDSMRLYTHQDHYIGGPIADFFVASDVMEYSVWGSDDGDHFVLLSDVVGVALDGGGPGLPTYTFHGTPPSIIYRGGSQEFGLTNAYTREYVFPTSHHYYGVRASTVTLDANDGDPEIDAVAGFNIADRPPGTPGKSVVVQVRSPEDGSSFPAGSSVLVTGYGSAPVTVDGTPVEATDASGNFFARVTVAAGRNVFHFVATDAFGQMAMATLTQEGIQPPVGPIDFSLFSDVSASFRADYARTSYNRGTGLLYADAAVHNIGDYPAGAPLLVGVEAISDPTVRVAAPDGVTPDGVPYYDFTR